MRRNAMTVSEARRLKLVAKRVMELVRQNEAAQREARRNAWRREELIRMEEKGERRFNEKRRIIGDAATSKSSGEIPQSSVDSPQSPSDGSQSSSDPESSGDSPQSPSDGSHLVIPNHPVKVPKLNQPTDHL
uniref:AsIV-cont00018-ORF1 n=1 Tax=Apophua simplicipes ichnovirus TaxID=1329648 RepID=S5DYS3_9VIRU|nr:AsIV-cont00018-ORF1 [Apophua simplicipes ichnovirus]